MRKLALLAGVALMVCLGGRPAAAQGVFADVPTDHWAYDAVNELAAAGIFTGYPDNTFGGKRALTRYEFAVAIQRMLQDIQRRIDARAPGVGGPGAPGPPGPRGPAGPPGPGADPEALRRLRSDVDTLQRLAREFSDTLAALGTDVDQLKRDLAALAERVGRVEETLAKMPVITGTATLAFIGHDLDDPGNFPNFGFLPTDIDGRPIPLDSNLLESVHAIYDVDLGITARLSDVATARILLNAGNYLGGYLNDTVSFVRPVGNKTLDNVRIYYAYLDTPIALGGLGASVTIGKFGQQFTPYTLKLIDVDSYTNLDKTDSGDYPVLGGRVNFKLGGVNVQYYAGKHEEVGFADLTSTAGVEVLPNFTFDLNGPPFFGNPNDVVGPLTEIDQSHGVRVSFGVPLQGTLGLTGVEGTGSNDDRYHKLRVYGADLNATLFKSLGLYAEWAQSEWRSPQRVNANSDSQAFDGRLTVNLGKLGLTGRYQRVGISFDAPGYWGRIGRWKNPRGLEGWGGKVTYPFGNRTALEAEYMDYRFINLPDADLKHIRAGFRFGLTSSNSVDLGWEWAEYDLLAGVDAAEEEYINIGWGFNLSATTSFKLLYQIIDFQAGGAGGLVAPFTDYDAAVAVTQFTVRF